ncbi:MAG: hypothetical protein Q4C85_08180 [Actinomyces sp.]|uniref:hypothetical protein n=1 Tax=Actinomyces sp. TaxID=29317 RepID=UPI0026DBB3E6|nr:hypothetical protein [Actinomyces sp.]MDO4243720.1 hypothetical protein [Actinomyces sp.]
MGLLASPAGLLTVGLIVLAALGPILISGILLCVGLETGEVSLGGTSMLTTFLVASGAVAGGGFTMEHEYFKAFISLLCLGPLVAVGVLTAWTTRRRSPVDSRAASMGPLLLRSLVEGLVAAAVTALLTGLATITSGGGFSDPLGLTDYGELTISPSAPRIFLAILLVSALGSATGRLSRLPASGMPPWWSRSRQVRIEVVQSALVLAAVFTAAVLILTIIAAVDDPSILLAIPLVAPNLVVGLLTLGALGGVSASSTELGSPSETHYAWTDSAWGWLLVVLAVLAFVVVALRVGVHRQRLAAPRWSRCWQLPAAWTVIWIPLVLAALSGGGSVSSSFLRMEFSISPSVLALVTVPIAVAIVSVLAELLPAPAYGLFPRLLQVLAGRRALESWVAGTPQAVPIPGAPLGASAPAMPQGAPAPAMPQGAPALVAAQAAAPPPPPTEPLATSAFPIVGQSPSPAQPVGAAPAAGAPSLAPPPPMSPSARQRLRLGLFAAAVLALAVIAGVVAVAVLNSSRTPEAAAREYVELIAAGEADAATALVDPGVPNAQRGLLTDAAMSGRTSTMTVQEVEVSSDSPDDSSTVIVDVDYQIDGEKRQAQVEVKKRDNSMIVLHEWEVSSSLAVPCEITAEMVDSVMVGRASIAMEDPSQDGDTDTYERTVTVYAYPGIYTVTASKDLSTYVTMDDGVIDAGDDQDWDTAAVSMTVEPSDELETKVLEAVKSAVETCASVPGNTGSECPWQVQSTNLQSLRVSASPTEITELSVGSFTSGSATIAIKPKATQWNPDPPETEIEFTMQGNIEFDDAGEPEITVTDSW